MRKAAVCTHVQHSGSILAPLTTTSIQLKVSTLILGCRNVVKGEAAKQELRLGKGSVSKAKVWQVDMANYASAKALSAKIDQELPRLDALIANAGISTNDYHVAENLEQTLTVNVVSTFLLALLCLPNFEQAAANTWSPSNLVVVGSAVHCFADHKQLQHPPIGKAFATLSNKDEADMAPRYFPFKLVVVSRAWSDMHSHSMTTLWIMPPTSR